MTSRAQGQFRTKTSKNDNFFIQGVPQKSPPLEITLLLLNVHYHTCGNCLTTKMAYLPSRKNLANESLRNCDVRQVFVHQNIFKRF